MVNAVLTDPLPGDAVAESYAQAQRRALAALPARLAEIPTSQLALLGSDLTGIAALRALTSPADIPDAPPPAAAMPHLGDLIDTVAAGAARAILVIGKGGVGKTTIATHLASGWPNAGCRCTCPPPTPPAGSRSSPTGLPNDQVLIVTYAETTPVAEAAELQEDLRRAGVEPFGWVINASLAASGTRRPAARPARCLEKHRTCVASASGLAARVWLVPWSSPPATT